jgi:hypothetical protein
MLRAKGIICAKSSSSFRCVAAKIKLDTFIFAQSSAALTIISELKGKYLVSQINLLGMSLLLATRWAQHSDQGASDKGLEPGPLGLLHNNANTTGGPIGRAK